MLEGFDNEVVDNRELDWLQRQVDRPLRAGQFGNYHTHLLGSQRFAEFKGLDWKQESKRITGNQLRHRRVPSRFDSNFEARLPCINAVRAAFRHFGGKLNGLHFFSTAEGRPEKGLIVLI